MDKEKILAKSRQEKTDEGMEFAMDRGRRSGVAAMSLCFGLICLFNLWQGCSNYAVFALYWVYLGFEGYGKYAVTKQKGALLGTVLGIMGGVLFFVVYVMQVMRG